MSPFCKIGHNTCGAFSSRHHFHLVNRKTSEDEICRGWCTLIDSSFNGRPPRPLAKLWVAKPLHTFSLARREIGVTLMFRMLGFWLGPCFYIVLFTFLLTFVVRTRT